MEVWSDTDVYRLYNERPEAPLVLKLIDYIKELKQKLWPMTVYISTTLKSVNKIEHAPLSVSWAFIIYFTEKNNNNFVLWKGELCIV